jgi:two-component system chemotaxis response regulator CheB
VAHRDIVVIGCSVGGVAGLPKTFPAAVFVVLHVSPQSTSVLPQILNRAGQLTALHPHDNDPIRPGHIYVAPPDNHLMLEDGRVRVTHGPKENRHRPAVDPLFRSAARWYGPRVIGVVLTGSLDDGTAGLLAIKKQGGVAIVQDPEEAMAPGMPESALEVVSVDHVATLEQMPELLNKLVRVEVMETSKNGKGKSSRLRKETEIAELDDMKEIEDENRPGTPSPFACPDCGGVLWELDGEEMLPFRCRVGHAYTAGSLSVEQTESVEGALWAAMRALEEGASLARRMANSAKGKHPRLESKYRERAKTKMEHAEVLRKLIVDTHDIHNEPLELEKNAS